MAGDYALSAKLRDTIAKIARNEIRKTVPAPRVGEVERIDSENNECYVLFPGEDEAFPVKMTYGNQPRNARYDAGHPNGDGKGDVVRVGGRPGSFFLMDVLTSAAVNKTYEPVVDIIDTGQLPSDGVPPSVAPVLYATAGLGVIFLQWNAIANQSEVTYKVYVSSVTPVAISDLNLVGTSKSDIVMVDKLADGTPLDTSVTYYAKIVPTDADGTGPASNEVSAQPIAGIDPAEITQLNTDLAAARSDIDTLNNTTIPNLNTNLTQARSDIATLNNTTIPNLNTQLSTTQSNLTTAQGDITTLQNKFPVQTNDLGALAVTSAKIADTAITSAKLVDGSVSTSKLLDGAITTSKIIDGAVATAKLIDSAVSANKIAAGAVTTEKLTVGSMGDDALLNGSFEEASASNPSMPAGWLNNGYGGDGTVQLDTTQFASGTKSLKITTTATTAPAPMSVLAVPVTPGETWMLTAKVLSGNAGYAAQGGIFLRYRDQNGDDLVGLTGPNGSLENVTVSGSSWTTLTAVITIPTQAKTMRPYLLLHGPSGGAGSIFVDQISLRKVVVSAQIADGAIVARKIAAGAITADKLTVASVGDNLIINGNFRDLVGDAGSAPLLWGSENTNVTGPITTQTEGDKTYIVLDTPSGATMGAAVYQVSDQGKIQAGPRDQFYVEFGALSTGGNHTYQMCMWTYDRYGTFLDFVFSPTFITEDANITYPARNSATLTVTSNSAAAYVRFGFRPLSAGAHYFFDNYIVGKVNVSARIADGAIVANKIAAGAITAEKLTVGSLQGDNRVLNGNIEDAPAIGTINLDSIPGWSFASDYGTGTVKLQVGGGALGSGKSIGVVPANSNSWGWTWSAPIPVIPGEVYYWSTRYLATAAISSGIYNRLTFYNKATSTSYADGLVDDNPQSGAIENWGAAAANTWYFAEGQVTVPAGATHLRMRLHAWAGTAGAAVFFDDMTLKKVEVSASIADGAIVANKIAAGAITADKLTVASLQGNLVSNPGFEDAGPVVGGKPTAIGWFERSGGSASTYREVNNGYTTSGSANMVLYASAGAGNYGRVSQSNAFPVEEGATYFASSLWGSTAWTSKGAYFRVCTGSDEAMTLEGGTNFDIGGGDAAMPSGKGSKRFEGQFTVPAGHHWARVTLYNYEPNVSCYYIVDDVTVRKVQVSASIADGAITASKITAGAITAEKLTVGSLSSSLVKNGNFQDYTMVTGQGYYGDRKPDGWTKLEGQYGGGSNPYDAYPGGIALVIMRNSSGYGHIASDPFPVSVGDTIAISCRVGYVGATPGFYFRINWLDASKVPITFQDVVINDPLTGYFGDSSRRDVAGSFVVPSSARFARIEMFNYGATGTDSYVLVNNVAANKAIISAQIADGAIITQKMISNSILGDRIQASTLDAGRITAGTITTDRMTANTISGDRIQASTLDAGKITAGTITTDRMTANTINGDRITTNTLHADRIKSNTITTDQLYVNQIVTSKLLAGALDATTITGATIQTSSTQNQGIKLSASAFNAWDSSGTNTINIDGSTGILTGKYFRSAASGARVEIGDWVNNSNIGAIGFYPSGASVYYPGVIYSYYTSPNPFLALVAPTMSSSENRAYIDLFGGSSTSVISMYGANKVLIQSLLLDVAAYSVRMPNLVQSGTDQVIMTTANVTYSKTVTFPNAFDINAPVPYVVACAVATGPDATFGVSNVTRTGFTFYARRPTANVNLNFNWIAVSNVA